MTPRAAAVVLAGGSGTRVGAGVNKVYLPLAGRSVLAWSFEWARRVPHVVHFLLVVRPEDRHLARAVVDTELAGLGVEVVDGGSTRHGSEQAALAALADRVASGDVDVVAIHDGARPLAGPALWRSVVETAARVGGALPGIPAEGVVEVDGDGAPSAPTPDPATHLVRVQTPQAFRAAELMAAYAAAARAGDEGTDTASTLETYSHLPVRVVPGTPQNLKLTWPQDLLVAERLLAAHGGAAGWT